MMPGPLSGLRVVVTRPRSQSGSLVQLLEEAGAEAVLVPVISIEDPADGGSALRSGLAELASGDWLVVTSSNGAARVGAVIAARPLADGVKMATIGPATSREAELFGLKADLVPRRAIAEGLLEVFPDPPSSGGRVMLARAEMARDVLPTVLTDRGWEVDDVAAYRTVSLEVDSAAGAACRRSDVVMFTSSSTVTSLVEAIGVEGLPPLVVSIGPATSATAQDAGVNVAIEAQVHTISGAVSALVEHLSVR